MGVPRTTTVFVSGIFNVLHPGHVRLLRFARSLGTELIVGVLADGLAGEAATLPEQQRIEAVESLKMVDRSVVVRDSVVDAISRLKPAIVVKGREHRLAANPEESALREYGGALIFSSGDSFFYVTDVEADSSNRWGAQHLDLPASFMKHHGITRSRLADILYRVANIRVLVVGDVIVDEYVSCHPLGMSREDPTLVVTPVDTHRFIGGAAIVAGHAGSLGQSSTLFSVTGNDEQGSYLREELDRLGVQHAIRADQGRPTTTKQRFRASGKTLLRVSHLRQDGISESLQKELEFEVRDSLGTHDLLIFSDFNYGVLPQPFVDHLTAAAGSAGLVLAADSQTSSQVGDISRFTGMDLITPTEYEARVAMRNFEDGLVVLADQLRDKARAGTVLMTLAEDGLFIRGASDSSPATTDRVPALNAKPKDVAGAGDSLLVVAAMALAAGANYNEAALLGSIAAALQVSETGNRPLDRTRLLEALGE